MTLHFNLNLAQAGNEGSWDLRLLAKMSPRGGRPNGLPRAGELGTRVQGRMPLCSGGTGRPGGDGGHPNISNFFPLGWFFPRGDLVLRVIAQLRRSRRRTSFVRLKVIISCG